MSKEIETRIRRSFHYTVAKEPGLLNTLMNAAAIGWMVAREALSGEITGQYQAGVTDGRVVERQDCAAAGCMRCGELLKRAP